MEKTLVEVTWRDVIATNEWETEITCPTIVTLGYLVSDDGNTLTIANTIDYEDWQNKSGQPVYYGLTAFPKGCVMSVKQV